jgi:SAM-dependent methyltransferase
VGIDVSTPLLVRARQRAAALLNVQFLEQDAQTGSLMPNRDLVFTRFGVMFFGDPLAAFRNLSGALRPQGRLVFVCWRRFEENPWLHLPFSAVRETLPAAPVPPVQGPSPFAFADREKLGQLLRAAGFDSILIERIDQDVQLGRDLASATRFAMHTGPVGRGLVGSDEATRWSVHYRIRTALSGYAHPDGVSLPGSAWVVTAVASTTAT